MILEDLRARATSLTEGISRAEDLLGNLQLQAQSLSTLLNNYNPEPPQVEKKIRFALHKYDTNTPIWQGASVIDAQDFDGFENANWPAGAEKYLIAAYVKRPRDPNGFTQYLKPSLVSDSELAHRQGDSTDKVFRPINSGDYLLDFSNPQLRQRMITSVIARAKTKGVHGVYSDEVDQQNWAWPDYQRIEQFPTADAWRASMVLLVEELASALHKEGLKHWINLGADYDVTNPWQSRLIAAADGINIEFFVGRTGVNMSPAIGDDWIRQVMFVHDVESKGKAVHVHASTRDQWVTNYAFGSWLLGTRYNGSFTSSIDYGGVVQVPSAFLLDPAQRLGYPVTSLAMRNGLWVREFQNGRVEVNNTLSSISALASRSVRIVTT